MKAVIVAKTFLYSCKNSYPVLLTYDYDCTTTFYDFRIMQITLRHKNFNIIL